MQLSPEPSMLGRKGQMFGNPAGSEIMPERHTREENAAHYSDAFEAGKPVVSQPGYQRAHSRILPRMGFALIAPYTMAAMSLLARTSRARGIRTMRSSAPQPEPGGN